MTSIIWTLGVAFLALLSQIQAQPVGGVDVETKQKTIDEFVGKLRQANLSNVDYELFQKVAQHDEVFGQFKTRWNATKELFTQDFVNQQKAVISTLNSLVGFFYLSSFQATRQSKLRSIYDFVISHATLEDKESLNVKESELPPEERATAGSKQIIVQGFLKYLKKVNLTNLNFTTFEEKAKSDKITKQFASLWRSDKSSDGKQVIDFHEAVEGLPDSFAAFLNSSSIKATDNIILVIKDDNVPEITEKEKPYDMAVSDWIKDSKPFKSMLQLSSGDVQSSSSDSKGTENSDKESTGTSGSAGDEPSDHEQSQWFQNVIEAMQVPFS